MGANMIVTGGLNACRGCGDYSGFDRENWGLRSMEHHRRDIDKVLEQVTKTGIELAESHYGVRYSVLLALLYFYPVKFTIIVAVG